MEQDQVQGKVLGIGGSPRKNGNSDVLLSEILRGAADNSVRSSRFHLRDIHFQSCIGCEKCRKTGNCRGSIDGMQVIYPEIRQSRGLVLVSPVHNYNVTAWMKAFIDRLYCFYIFDKNRPGNWSSRLAGQGRKAVIAAIGEQESKEDMGMTLDAMRMPLEALGYEIVGSLPVFSVFDRGKIREHADILSSARELGKKLAGCI